MTSRCPALTCRQASPNGARPRPGNAALAGAASGTPAPTLSGGRPQCQSTGSGGCDPGVRLACGQLQALWTDATWGFGMAAPKVHPTEGLPNGLERTRDARI
ncbi:hypothetical protein Aglo01_57470 [Actinokineospora globicatena]|nr:hypothetical protein Aglo01_57470 [Actinokineospora globicatena]GLW88036.1 hypothetical protein Aglo02_56750 [Actinokineospora globicatena]